MYCNACGSELNTAGRFCPRCGRVVTGAPGGQGVRAPMERPREGRKIAGVCLAIANNLNADPTLVRVLWAVVTLCTGIVFGIVAYAVAWVLIPEAPLPAAGAIAPAGQNGL